MDTTKEECKKLADNIPICGRIMELFDLEDSKVMLTKTREIIQNIRKDQDIECNPTVLKSFVHLFFKQNYKGSKVVTVRRLISSFFNRLPAESQSTARTIFVELTEKITRDEIASNTPAAKARECVDILASLLENFPLGEDCVRTTVIGYTRYLTDAHNHFIRMTYDASSPVELNEAMHHCLVTEQLMNRMLQKCFETLRNKFVERDERLAELIHPLVKASVGILSSDHLVIDCRCNAAITLTFVLRICCVKSLGQILQVMMNSENNKQTLSSSLPDLLKGTDILEIGKQTLSTTSYLCFLFGVLSILDSDYLTLEVSDENFVVTELFLKEVLLLVPEVTNPASKVVLAKLINLWTMKALSLAESSIPLDPKLVDKISGGSDAVNNVLNYLWNALDDSLDVVRQNAKSSFDHLVKTHVKLTNCCVRSDEFVMKLIKDVLDIPWCKRGKYPPLSCLVTSLGTHQILLTCPDLTSLVIQQLDDHTLACYCSEFYEKLYQCHKTELGKDDPGSSSIWLNKWVDPILDALCVGSKRTKMNILQYILPKLVSTSNHILQYMISYLSRKPASSSGTLGALLMCLRRGRALGLLDDRKSDSKSWCGVVSVDVLEYALSSSDEQIRLDAYSLLCENKKTTEAVKPIEFELVRTFIPMNLNNQSPSFRQNVSSYTKKFFVRMKDSENSLLRQLKKVKTAEEESRIKENLVEYERFLTWLQDYLFGCLYIGAAFATRTSALNMLSNMVRILENDNNETKSQDSFSFFKDFQKSHVYTLMECLCDTFEENKTEALSILQRYFKIIQEPVFSVDQLRQLFKTCIKLSVSVRPQDSTISAYLALCLLKVPGISEVVSTDVLDLKVLDRNQVDSHADIDGCPDSSFLSFIQVLVLSLKDQTEVAKKRLILAAANRPIYPTIHCMRYILGEVNMKAHSSSRAWKEVIVKVVNVCLDVAAVVSPVVQDSSPEGNVPEEAIRGPGLDFGMIYQNPEDRQMLLEAEESEKTVTLMPEYLVVCCWRSIKEVSLLLGEITKNASIEDQEFNLEGLLSFDLITHIGDYFINQLLASKHRGAFELAYAGFVLMCERLWRSPSKKLHKLPETWFLKLMEDIKTDDGNSGLCSTRRSAGIPFYVQALLTTEPPANEQKCFHQAMRSLLDLAVSDSSLSVIDNPPKVHALNILRVLFKDNRLGDFVAPYVSDGLRAAILGFKSNYWAVRNSSTLLLSALMVRIFGVKVSKDDSELSRKNCLTGRAFFHRFPKVYNFLLKEFEAATQVSQAMNDLQLHPSLYPVLMVLGRLFPSAMEGADSNLNLAAFIPLVMSCASSPVYKTRIMAARAIQPLVEKDRLSTILVQLVKLLPQNHQEKLNFNHLHGVLLQIKFLLDAALELSPAVQETVGSSLTGILMDYTWILTTENRCAMTVEIAFEFWDCALSLKCGNKEDMALHPVYQHYIGCLKSALPDGMKGSPGQENCRVAIAKLAIKYFLSERNDDNAQTDLYMYLLDSDSYEVRLAVLRHFLTILNPVISEERSSLEASQICSKVHLIGRTEILRSLFTMAVYTEWHFECIGLVFEVLASFPNSVIIIPELEIKKDGQCTKTLNQKEIFLLCLNRLDAEGRVSINCALLKFLSKFVPLFYEFSLVSITEFTVMMSSWCRILKQFASTENDADLQLSVAEVLLDNADILLVDSRAALEGEVLNYWQILLDLLQEDDLDVKEVASKVLTKLDGSLQGDLNPACALHRLLGKMIDIHWERLRGEILVMLLTLLKGNLSHPEKSSGEDRLFDKGEMNTYRDELSFAKLVAEFLSKALQMLNLDLEKNGQDLQYLLNADVEELGESESCENTRSLKGCVHLLKESFDHTSAGLHSVLSSNTPWNLSTVYEESCSYSLVYIELARSLLYIMCYDRSLVKSGVSHVHLQPLWLICNSLLDDSCPNYCLTHIEGEN